MKLSLTADYSLGTGNLQITVGGLLPRWRPWGPSGFQGSEQLSLAVFFEREKVGLCKLSCITQAAGGPCSCGGSALATPVTSPPGFALS